MGAPQIQEPISPVAPTGAPPAAVPSPASPAVAPASNTPWYGEIKDPDLKGWAELKSFKDPQTALIHGRDVEKLLGVPKDEMIRLPKDAKPEDLAAVYDKLGRPKTADEYKFEQVEGADPNFEKAMRPVLHDVGLTQAQATKLQGALNTYAAAKAEADRQQLGIAQEAEWTKLHQEWPGKTFDERQELARRGATAVGLTQEELLAIETEVFGKGETPGNAKLLRAFAKIGEQFGESKFAANAGPSGNSFHGMTPEAADARLNLLMADKEWGKRFYSGDVAAKQELDNLNRIIASGRAAQQQG